MSGNEIYCSSSSSMVGELRKHMLNGFDGLEFRKRNVGGN